MPCVGRGDSEVLMVAKTDGWLFTEGDNCSCSSILFRTEGGNTADQVPKRCRIALY